MQFGRLNRQPKSQWEKIKAGDKSVKTDSLTGASKAESVTLQINNTPTNIQRGNIRDVAGEFSAIAYDMGNTNDEEDYAEEMTDQILDAFKEVSHRQIKRKRPQK